MKPIPFARRYPARIDTRRGSTLIIVVALLGMLAFLGFVFYTFAKQEKANAASFAKGAQVLKAPSLEPDSLFDFALQQIILGPPDAYTQSILWGGRHSLLANMFGRDGIPWNGEGVNLIQDSAGQPHVDMNFNGTNNDPNDNQLLLNVVDSPAANSGIWSFGTADAVWGHVGSTSFKIFRGTGTGGGNTNSNLNFYIPEPDVNYNSPNIDSLFLSYDGVALDNTANPTNSKRVIIPSFLRPQYLRLAGTVPLEDANRNGFLDPANGNIPAEDANGNGQLDDWYQLPAFANQVMRPHPSHVCVDGNGNPIFADSNGKNTLARYINSIRYYALKNSGVSLRRPFTSLVSETQVNSNSIPGSFAPPESSLSNTPGSLGVWTPSTGAGSSSVPVVPADIDLDVDTDGDGVMDAILMDLGFPPVRRGDGKLVVPLFAISIRDLNGLLNVNATGNLSGNLNLTGPSSLAAINSGTIPPAVPPTQLGFRQTGGTFSGNKWTGLISTPDSLSKSNLGLSTYEINIQRALTANPDRNASSPDTPLLGSEAATQLSYFLHQFDTSIDTYNVIPQPGRSITELANLEWLMLNVGRAGFQLGLAPSATHLYGAINSVYAGRQGDPTRLWNYASSQVLTDLPKPGLSTTWASGVPTNWPLAANSTLPNPDDNNNVNEGESIYNTRWGTPLDFLGSGQAFQRYSFGPDGKPGAANQDDDANGIIDDISEEGWSNTDDVIAYGKYPEFAHYSPNPLATSAIYSSNYKVGGKPLTPWLTWPAYQGYHSYNGSAGGGVRWGDQQSSSYYQWLMSGSHSDSLLDDPAEAIIDPVLMSSSYLNFVNYLYNLTTYTGPSSPVPPAFLPPSPMLGLTATASASFSNSISNDAVFGPEEMLFLQGSSADGRLTDSRSRLADLMPGNLVASQNAPSIRKRLTTVSQDRREFGLGVADVGGVTTSGGNSSSGGLRSWEVLTTGFPPSLTNGTANPYRQELYSYLQQVTNGGIVSQKLNVNRWLYLDGLTGTQYGFAPLPEQTTPSDSNAALARQQMARDIYTLLYTFCSVQANGTTGDADYRYVPTPPTAAQAKEMAQFAVNLVDALDADNIVTAFYFDADLSQNGQGWQTTSTGTQDYMYGIDGVAGNADDNVVYGVERQLLTFSEAAAFVVKPTSDNSDSNMTIFDDKQTPAEGRPYIFFELQNVSPIPVALASSPNITSANATTTADWRVRMVSPTDETKTYSTVYFLPGLTSSSGATPSNFLSTDPTGGTNPVLLPGAVFSVASQDGTDKVMGAARTSDFRADTSLMGSSFPLAVPTSSNIAGGLTDTPITPSTQAKDMIPRCNLDLVWSYPDNKSRFLVTTGTTDTPAATPGAFAAQLIQVSTANPNKTVRLILERRAAAGPDVPKNFVWAPVDKTSSTASGAGAGAGAPPAPGGTNDVAIGSVTPPINSAGAGAVTTALQSANSYPRSIPLLSATTSTTTQLNNNTINAASTTPANATSVNSVAWQLHNDRDFGSLSELLLLPLYGSDNLTAALSNVIDANSGHVSTGEFYEANQKYYPTFAAARFLRPDNPDYSKNNVTPNYGNRWYRLFDFLEVPNRSHQHSALSGSPPSGAITTGTAIPNYGLPVTFANAGMPGATSYSPTAFSPTTNPPSPNSPVTAYPTTMMFSAPFGYPQFFGWPKTHGLLNLNMIRDPQVLAALIDDDQVIQDPRINLSGNAGPYLDSADPSDANRKWWFEFLKSRDSRYLAPASGTAFAVDPVTNLYVPGTANSRPFRSIDAVGPQAVSITAGANLDSQLENTIFRSLPMDSGSVTNSINESRRLFEVGSNGTDHIGPIDTEASGNPLHPTSRYRLMSKLLNNTTTRSNSFGVYITVQYYEAVQVYGYVGTGQNQTRATAVQIGGRLDDAPTHRGFFIVDRTGAIEQMKILATNSGGTANVVSPNSYSFQPNTDTSGLRVNLNGIRWKDLVLYRQTLN